MSTTATASRSSAERTRRHRERRREGTRCVTVDINQSERDALVARGYLSEEERTNGAAIKKAIEGVLSDLVFELQSETAEHTDIISQTPNDLVTATLHKLAVCKRARPPRLLRDAPDDPAAPSRIQA